jgi:hypothetical protein
MKKGRGYVTKKGDRKSVKVIKRRKNNWNKITVV